MGKKRDVYVEDLAELVVENMDLKTMTAILFDQLVEEYERYEKDNPELLDKIAENAGYFNEENHE